MNQALGHAAGNALEVLEAAWTSCAASTRPPRLHAGDAAAVR